jgi:hypothetical protein
MSAQSLAAAAVDTCGGHSSLPEWMIPVHRLQDNLVVSPYHLVRSTECQLVTIQTNAAQIEKMEARYTSVACRRPYVALVLHVVGSNDIVVRK